VEQCDPTEEEQQHFILDHRRQLSALVGLSRVRPIEDRLLRALIWLGERFGRVNSFGVSLSLSEMNLTHRNLAELIGSTRVTVTKSLTRLRQEGLLINTGHDDVVIPHRKAIKSIDIKIIKELRSIKEFRHNFQPLSYQRNQQRSQANKPD